MKSILLTVAILIAASSLAVSQTVSNKNKRSRGEQNVQTVLDEAGAALARNDAAALERIYADDWTFVSPFGALVTKEQRLAALRSGNLKYESVSRDEMNIRIYGNTAVAVALQTSKAQSGGQDVSGQYRVTIVLAKKGGRWQIVAQQATRVPPQ